MWCQVYGNIYSQITISYTSMFSLVVLGVQQWLKRDTLTISIICSMLSLYFVERTEFICIAATGSLWQSICLHEMRMASVGKDCRKFSRYVHNCRIHTHCTVKRVDSAKFGCCVLVFSCCQCHDYCDRWVIVAFFFLLVCYALFRLSLYACIYVELRNPGLRGFWGGRGECEA